MESDNDALEVSARTVRASNFRDVDLSGSTFDDVRLAASTFENVELSKCVFVDASLRGTRITNADLRDVEIADAQVSGMRIEGVLVTDLFEAYESSNRSSSDGDVLASAAKTAVVAFLANRDTSLFLGKSRIEKARELMFHGLSIGSRIWTRTRDPLINSQLLYQLSYSGTSHDGT